MSTVLGRCPWSWGAVRGAEHCLQCWELSAVLGLCPWCPVLSAVPCTVPGAGALSSVLKTAHHQQRGRLSLSSAHGWSSSCPTLWFLSHKPLLESQHMAIHLALINLFVVESCVQRTVKSLAPKVSREWCLLKIRLQLGMQEPG